MFSFSIKQGVFVAAFLMSAAGFAQSNTAANERCGTETFGDQDVEYCIYPTVDSKNHDLLVHFHGLGGGVSSWQEEQRHINTRRELESIGKSVPTVVSISFGKLWLLTNVQDHGDTYNLVKDKVLPFLEEKAGFHHNGRLMLMGESMGGFNALQFYVKDPQIFSRYIIMCPALSQLNPWSSDDDIASFIDRTGASTLRVAFYVEVAKNSFSNMDEWNANNPLSLVKNRSGLPPVFLSGDEQDQYGFYEGDKIMNDLLKTKASEYQWSSVNGPHCQVDSKSIAKFF